MDKKNYNPNPALAASGAFLLFMGLSSLDHNNRGGIISIGMGFFLIITAIVRQIKLTKKKQKETKILQALLEKEDS